MRNRLLLVPGMLAAMTIVAFTDKIVPSRMLIGTYGICDCGDVATVKFNLVINDDQTFHYYKNDDPAHIIDVKGRWEPEGNSILLKDYDAAVRIHDRWTLDKNETCLKSRKGLEWTRLCRVKP